MPATPNARGLTLDSIVDAALGLIREEGFPALSMRRLADRCGVGAMTLYGYVRTKDELLGMIADDLLAAVDLPATRDLPWEDRVRGVFRSVRRIFLEHPELADVVARQHLNSVSAYRGAEVVLDAVRQAGLDDQQAVSAFVALTAFTTGLAQREAHAGERAAQQGRRLMAIHQLPPDDFRNLVELGPLMVVGESERHFEDGLDLIIRGIAARGGSMIAIADSLRTLDARWFTTALRDPGGAQAAVRAVTFETMAVRGAIADMARVRLEYDGSGEPGPASLVAKIRGTTAVQAGMDAAMGLYAREARFYQQLAGSVPVGTPRCHHVGDGTSTPLLLEDLGGLRLGDQMQGLAPVDAERLVDTLADLHARYWESPALEQDWLLSPGAPPFAGMVAQLVSSGVDALRERYSGRVPAGVLDAVAQAAPRWCEILGRGAEGPMTLVHHDCRLDNIFFRDDGDPVLVDWQVVARTRGTQDVANLLAGSMDVEALGASWEPLLRRYHDRLRERGVRDYGWGDCMTHYRQNILYPLGAGMALLGHLDIGDDRGLGDAIVLRALTHVADLDSLAIV